MKKIFCLFLFSGMIVLAQDHPNFSGNWQLDANKSENPHAKDIALAIQQDDDSITVTSQEEGKSLEFKCATNGQNCKMKGEPADVSVYYNGALLVELDMEHNGDHVIKKRIHMGNDGKTLEVELMRVNPPGPTEKLVFTKK